MVKDPDTPALPGLPVPTRGALTGIALMIAGFLFYSLSDALAKLLTAELPPLQVAWFRQLGLLSGVVLLLALRGPAILRSARPLSQIARGLTVVVAVTCFITAVSYVPLADAVAVSFVAPFIVTILAALVLGEHVGLHRWLAVTVGFAGTLVVIRPGLGLFHPAIFLVLIAASAFAIRQILSRRVMDGDTTATTVAYTGLTASAVLTLPLPFVWVTPGDATTLWLIVAMAALAGLAEFLIIRALELSQAVILAPMMYSLMIWSTLWGFLLFAELPDRWTMVGAVIIVGSGLLTIYREARRARR